MIVRRSVFPLVSVATSVSIQTACLNELCLEAKTDLHCLEHSELLFHVAMFQCLTCIFLR